MRGKWVKPVAIGIGLFLMLAVATFPYDHIAKTFVQELQITAAQSRILIDVDQAKTNFPVRLLYTNVVIRVPVPPLYIPIVIDKLEIQTLVPSLLISKPSFDFDLIAYAGNIEGWLYHHWFSSNADGEIHGSGLSLSEHPLFYGLGISGILSFASSYSTSEQSDGSLTIQNGELKISLENGQYTGNYKIGDLIQVPTIQDLDITIKASVNNNVIDLSSLELQSSLGNATGLGSAQILPNKQIALPSCRIEVSLNPKGQKELGGYFTLAAGISFDDPPAAKWLITCSTKQFGLTPQCSVTSL